jgi:AraC-like DNA-binding protein
MPVGRERLHAGIPIARHRHAQAYVAVVLSGGYVEAGDEGRRRVETGDALVHHCFDAHLDVIGPAGAEILNLPLPAGWSGALAFRVADADAVVRAAEIDAALAASMLCPTADASRLLDDWPDLLADALRSDPGLRLDRWAADMKLAPATVSRGFRAVFGTTPVRYWADARARKAWRVIAGGRDPLVDVALACGFADQAHMTRSVLALTGAPPSVWRARSIQFKTAAASAL